MQEQAKESEYTRRKLERARQEVVHHMTKIKNEKDDLEREVNIKVQYWKFLYYYIYNYLQNSVLKEALEAERKGHTLPQTPGCSLHDELELKNQVSLFKLIKLNKKLN